MKERILFTVYLISILMTGTLPAVAQSAAERSQLLEDIRFQFQPDALQAPEGNTAFLQGLYEKTPDFPLWLMMEMNGALLVDKDHFLILESSQDEDGVWIIDMSCVDSQNGYFRLLLAADPATGEAVLKLADHEEDLAIYQGKILPYEGPDRPVFRNAKRAQQAEETERQMDRLIPTMDFSVRLKPELYGYKASVTVTPDKIITNAPVQFETEDFRVICCEKQNGTWFLRFELSPADDAQEAWVMDLAVDAFTAETSYRLNYTDRLLPNWREIKDGKVEPSGK